MTYPRPLSAAASAAAAARLDSTVGATPHDEPPAALPAWLARLAPVRDASDTAPHRIDAAGAEGRLTACAPSRDRPWGRVSAVLPDAAQLPAAQLRASVAALYGALHRSLAQLGTPEPVRIWNFIPTIHARYGVDDARTALADAPSGHRAAILDRYRAFNLGRWDAFQRWLVPGREDDRAALARRVPTATGVGHAGRDLVIHILGAVRAGRPVENPRQRPAYRYSPRYGPLPPCFARATIVDAPSTAAGNDDPRAWLLVGGTASVRGELSVHEGDLGAQLEETFHNLDHLLRAAVAETGARGGRYVDLRVYHLDPVAAPPLRAAVHSAYPTLEGLETVRADICRRELLVEIEGVARLDR